MNFESIRHIQTEHWAIIAGFALLVLTFGSAAYIGARRLQMAKIWARKLLERGGRSENEILHAVGQMMFPIRMWLGAVLVFTYLALPALKSFTFDTIATTSCLLMLIYFFVHLSREQKLIFEIRKIDPKSAKVNTLAAKTFMGIFFAMIFSFAAATVITAFRQALIPLSGDIGFLFHVIEFMSVLIFMQILIAPIMVRIMFPSDRPSTESELRTEAVVKDAFKRLGLNSPQVRILKLDSIRNFNALIAGANRAPGPLRQIVLISQSDQLGLTQKETEAIIHHELAHGFLMHIPVRMVAHLAIGIAGVTPLLIASMYMELSHGMIYTPAAIVIFYLLIHPLIMSRLVREQEIQADEFAITRLNSSVHDLVSALTKATIASGELVDRKPAGNWMNAHAAHPTVLEREALLQRLQQNQHSLIKQTADLTRFRAVRQMLKDGIWRTTAAVNIVAIGILAFSLLPLKKDSATGTHWRAPASIESTLSAMQENPPKNAKPIRTEALSTTSL
jgi:Zn-dependent protease with chaperone function